MAIEDADIIHPSSALDKKRVYFGAMVKLLDDQTKSSLDVRIVLVRTRLIIRMAT